MQLAPDVIKLTKIQVWFGSGSDPSCKCSGLASRAECGTGLDRTNLHVHTSGFWRATGVATCTCQNITTP